MLHQFKNHKDSPLFLGIFFFFFCLFWLFFEHLGDGFFFLLQLFLDSCTQEFTDVLERREDRFLCLDERIDLQKPSDYLADDEEEEYTDEDSSSHDPEHIEPLYLEEEGFEHSEEG
jgi:hypothetical protein